MEFPFSTCPLTGIKTLGRATAVPTGGSQQVLYSFKPIGSAIFSLGQAIHLSRLIERNQLTPRPDLAGLCREAFENGASPFLITGELFAGPQYNTPESFEEKQEHFLEFLYTKGGREHKRRDIMVYDDFPLAYASDAKEFFEIIESLISEGLISCDRQDADPNLWPFGIRGEYYGILPTREGKQRARQILTPLSDDALLANNDKDQVLNSMPTNTAIEKIFISHSSKDADIVEEIIDLLEIIGVRHEQIFCSSFQGYSIELGQDFLQRIKDELNGNVLVLFVITRNFYSSPVSLCEMGAAWVKTSKHIPIVVPPLSYEDVKGVIPSTQGFKINEPLKWNGLKEQLGGWFSIQNKDSLSVWERKRDKALQTINQKIEAHIRTLEKKPITPESKTDTVPFGGISL